MVLNCRVHAFACMCKIHYCMLSLECSGWLPGGFFLSFGAMCICVIVYTELLYLGIAAPRALVMID